MGCFDTNRVRKTSLGLIKVRKSSIGWKKPSEHSLPTGVKTARKGVRFAQHEEVAFRHVTQDELEKTWYQKADFDSFKGDCVQTAREYNYVAGDVTRLDPSKVCLRGLEQQLTRNSMLTRKITISSTIKMVVREQLCQKSMGYSNPEKVGELSRALSQGARDRAVTVADFDAKLCRLL